MPLQTILALVTIAAGVVGLITAWVKWWPGIRRFWSRVNGTLDAIGGREEYIDPASGRRVPELPPMVNRLATLEETTATLVTTVASLNDAHRRIDNHETRIVALETNTIERIATRAESAQMWRAVADADLDEDDE